MTCRVPFFLLASFMLVSMSMIKLAGVKMTLPQAATAQPEKKPAPIFTGAGE